MHFSDISIKSKLLQPELTAGWQLISEQRTSKSTTFNKVSIVAVQSRDWPYRYGDIEL